MATPEETRQRAEAQNELNRLGFEFVDILKQQAAAMQEVAKAQGATKGEMGYLNNLSKNAVKLAQDLADFENDDLKSKSKRAKLQNKLNKAQFEQVRLAEAMAELAEDDLEGRKKILRVMGDSLQTSKELTKEFKKLEDQIESIEGISKAFEGFEDVVKDIPVVREVFKELTTASQKVAENFAETGSGIKAMGAGLQEFGKGLAKVGFAAFMTAFINGLNRIENATIRTGRALGQTGDIAKAFGTRIVEATQSSQFLTEEVEKAAQGLSKNLGSGLLASSEQIKLTTSLSERLGIAADKSANLFRFASGTGKSFESVVNSAIGTTKALNATSDVTLNYVDILDDVSSASEATLLTSSKFPGGIAKAAFEARKFGLTLEQLAKIGESMLDFESSIASELEAELLLGRDINLQAARTAALYDDQAALAKAISDEVGTAEEFGQLNVIQQNALAKAFGMSRQELAKTLMQREALLDLEKENEDLAGLSKLETQEQLAKLQQHFISQGKTADQAELMALEKLGQTEEAQQRRAMTTQEQMAKLMEKISNDLASMLDSMLGISDKIKNLLDFASENVRGISNALIAAATIFAGGKMISMVRSIGKAAKAMGFIGKTASGASKLGASALTKKAGGVVMKGTGKVVYGAAAESALKAGTGTVAKAGGKSLAKAATKTAGKSVGKSLLKKIPGVGLLAGLAFAGQKLMEGDLAGAGLEALSGAVSLIPGAGTAASLAIDAGIAARDISRANKEQELDSGAVEEAASPSFAPVSTDFGTASTPEEALMMNNQLMQQLIDTVKQTGNVYIDGAKVGTTTVLASRQL